MVRTEKQLLEEILLDIRKGLLGNELNARYLRSLRERQPERKELEGEELRLLHQKEELVNHLEILGGMIKESADPIEEKKPEKKVMGKQKN